MANLILITLYFLLKLTYVLVKMFPDNLENKFVKLLNIRHSRTLPLRINDATKSISPLPKSSSFVAIFIFRHIILFMHQHLYLVRIPMLNRPESNIKYEYIYT